jgi:hypothetical protein
MAGTCRGEGVPNATRDSPNPARTGTPERLPREEWCDCFALAPRKQAGHNAAKGLGWPGLNIEYTTEAYLCQRAVPHLRNNSPPDQSRTRILRTETMTKSLHMIPQHQFFWDTDSGTPAGTPSRAVRRGCGESILTNLPHLNLAPGAVSALQMVAGHPQPPTLDEQRPTVGAIGVL